MNIRAHVLPVVVDAQSKLIKSVSTFKSNDNGLYPEMARPLRKGKMVGRRERDCGMLSRLHASVFEAFSYLRPYVPTLNGGATKRDS